MFFLERRGSVLYCIMVAMLAGLMFRVVYLSEESGISAVAEQQSSYQLRLGDTRGIIYDCKGERLTNVSARRVGVVMPVPAAMEAIREGLAQENYLQILEQLEKGHPVRVENFSSEKKGVYSFPISRRYAEETLAAHVLGYVDVQGNGVTGVEQAYNGWLKDTGILEIRYKVDALGRVLTGIEPEFIHTLDDTKGIALTLDKEIQQKIEEIARETIREGTIVVSDVASGKIRGLVSMPTFSPEDVEAATREENSPLMNRAFSAYNVGSVFKLVVAQTALEMGIDMELLCTGGTLVEGVEYQCIGHTAHGRVDLERALAVSCNCYFIHLARKCGGERILANAERLGFGKEIAFTAEWGTQPGVLPSEEELQNPNALANFSFGQGKLLATPLQITAMINAIANGGIYRTPTLVEAFVDSDGTWITEGVPSAIPTEGMSEEVAADLRRYMISAVEAGSAATGKPAEGGAGAKTATAETGWYRGEKAVIQTWYAGFFPAEEPKYSVIVLVENGVTGSSTCGPIFRRICDALAQRDTES